MMSLANTARSVRRAGAPRVICPTVRAVALGAMSLGAMSLGAMSLGAMVSGAVGCGGHQAAPAHRSSPASDHGSDSKSEASVERRPAERDAPRALGPTARYGDLVEAAKAADQAGAADSHAACLLRGSGRLGDAYRLEADIALAVRPLPSPSERLAHRLEEAPGPVRLFTRWGALGSHDEGLAVATFTSVGPPGSDPARVLFLTDQGVFMRTTASHGTPEAEPISLSALGPEALAEGDSAPYGLLVVTADADVPLRRLRALLARVPADRPVALGVVFPPETTLPGSPAGEREGAARCPDGLPAMEGESGEAQLDPAAARDALEPFRTGAKECMTAVRSAGGRLELALRVGPDGSVSRACVVRDEIGDPRLRTCILRRADELSLPTPEPPGAVDLRLPLLLRPTGSFDQAPLCPTGPGS